MKKVLVLFAVILVALIVVIKTQSAGATGPCIVPDSSLNAQETRFVLLLNNYRAKYGIAALTVAPTLNRSATWMSLDMAAKNYFSHTDSLGRDPFTRMRDCGYALTGGENLAMGNLPIADNVLVAWQNSPGHNALLLDVEFTQMGISHEGVYWTLDFGYGTEDVVIPWPTVVPTPTVVPCAYSKGWTLTTAYPSYYVSSLPSCVTAAYVYDSVNGWSRWLRGTPAYVNNLQFVAQGTAVWIYVR